MTEKLYYLLNRVDRIIDSVVEEELEDTKGVIKIRKWKKNRQHIGQKKKYKMTNIDLQNIDIRLKTGGK